MRFLSSVAPAVVLTFVATTVNAAVRFQNPVVMDKDAVAMSVAVADIDGDGALDLVAAVPEGIKVFYGDMRGGVRETETMTMPARPQAIALSDLNRDGVADVIATTSDGVWDLFSSGRHYTAPQRAGESDGLLAKVVDLNGDGVPDRVTMDGRSKALFIRLGEGLEKPVETADVVTSFAVADFDGDGRPDIAATTAFSNQISILLGDGRGGFVATNSIDAGKVPVAIAAGDIDRNGHPDLIVAYANGIAFIPNVTERRFEPAAPSRNRQAELLRPVALALPPAPCTISFTFTAGFQWSEPLSWIDTTTGTHRLPNGSDSVCIFDSPSLSGEIFLTTTTAIGSIQSFYHAGIRLQSEPGTTAELDLLDSAHSSTIQAITIANATLTAMHPVAFGSPVNPGSLHVFGGNMTIVSPQPGFDAMTVDGAVDWESGTLRTINGGARFNQNSQVWGQLHLCENTTLTLNAGTTLNLNGVILPCSSTGIGTLNLLDATINGVAENFPGIFTNITTSTFSGSVRPAFTVTGNGQMNIGNIFNSNAVQALSSTRLSVGTGATMILGGNIKADGLSSDGEGTTVVSGFLHGIFTPVSNPLNIGGGTLGAAAGDRADFTFATGPVTLGGKVVAHSLRIDGAGSQLNSPCIANGGVVEVHGMMTSSNINSVIDGSCAPGTGLFRIAFGGTLTVPTILASNPGVEFQNQGTVNVQSGTFTIWDSPLGQGSTGNFNLAAGSKILLMHEYRMSPGVVSGEGVLEAGYPLHLGGTTISNLKTSGSVDGSFTITGSLQLPNGGTISNGTATIAAGATLTAPQGARFSGAFVQINGTANLSSACVGDNASFNVNFGGVASINPPFGTIALGDCGSNGSLRINPNGRLVVNVTGRTAMVLPTQVFGRLEVAGGVMTYLRPSTWFAGSQLIVDGGATMSFQDTEVFNSGFQSAGGGLVSFDFGSYSGSPVFFTGVNFTNNFPITGSGNTILACCNTSNAIGRLSIPSGHMLTVNGFLNIGASGHISNAGTIEVGSGINAFTSGSAIDGTGLLHLRGFLAGGSPAGTTIDCTLSNDGRVIANAGTLTPRFITNNVSGTLTGGTWEADANSTLVYGGGTLNNNAANLVANGPSAVLQFFVSTNLPNGTMTLINGGTARVGFFENQGTVTIGAGSAFRPFGYIQSAGKTSLTDATAVLTVQGANATVQLQGGILEGIGTVSPLLQNLGGDLQPSLGAPNRPAPGTLTVEGNYSEGVGGTLHLFLHDQTHYSSLHVTGSASLAGTLQLDPTLGFDSIGDPIGSFVPNPGDAFQVLTYGSRSGSPATILGQDQTFIPDYLYTPHYNANDLTFIVETVDPKVMIANLETTIAGFGLEQGIANSLTSQLDAALSALQRGNSNAACGSLGATQNYVRAQSGKKLTQDQATTINDALQKIREKVGCR